MALHNNIKLKISQEVIDGIVDGQSVHRNEFGIHKGTFFSPDSKRLAYYSMDERMVSMYPLVNTNTRVASLKNVRYPMAGMLSHQVSIGIYDFEHFSVDFLTFLLVYFSIHCVEKSNLNKKIYQNN